MAALGVLANSITNLCNGVETLEKFHKWWQGEVYYIEGVILGIPYKRHWTDLCVRNVVEFYLKNWQWCWFFLVAICGVDLT